MMRVVLVLLALLMLPIDAGARPVTWKQKRIHVYDYSPASWDKIFAASVNDANAILPPRAPNVVYHRMTPVGCNDVPVTRKAVIICESNPNRWPPFLRESTAMTWVPRNKGRIPWSRVELNAEYPVYPEGMPYVACHELIGHAILGLEDDYYSKTPDESCIYADATRPGSWDAAYARKVYKKAKRR